MGLKRSFNRNYLRMKKYLIDIIPNKVQGPDYQC